MKGDKNRTPRAKLAWIIAENEQPWEPPKGMRKRRCAECGLWFAQPQGRLDESCFDCALARSHMTQETTYGSPE